MRCINCVFLLKLLVLNVFILCDGFINLADVDCGHESRRGRIVGGALVGAGELPWAASVWRQGAHQCGASVLTHSWLVTAAHCVCSRATFDFYFPRQLKVVVGNFNLSKIDSKESVTRILPHPQYRCETTENDIALLQTERPLTWTRSLRPACLPQPAAPDYSGSVATVAGWGWTLEDREKGERPNILNKVEVKVVENSLCSQWYHSQGKNIEVTETQMCAGHEQGGKDSCWADSGGPLVLEESGRAVLAGVVSTGHGCARPKLPGIYTRVSRYVDWIKNSIEDNTKSRTGLDWYPK